MTPWPHQERGFTETTVAIERGERRICLTSPTGGGKTLLIAMLIKWALDRGWKVVVYTNRKMLVTQLRRDMETFGVHHGIRAAGHRSALDMDVQISSIDTERERVLIGKVWDLHEAQLVIIDECHQQTGKTAETIMASHLERGAAIVGVTATPIGIGRLYQSLITAGRNSELRKCGALVPCYTYGPDEPDSRSYEKEIPTGEIEVDGKKKTIWTKAIFARVFEFWKLLNPEQKPTILFAPGVGESVWFAEQFAAMGVKAAHIDGEDVWIDGELLRSNQNRRDEILAKSESGEIKIICNRFVMREGVNMPWLYHGIFATTFGSVTSYVQAGGRLLRAHGSLDHVIVQDHGGNWWKHGSLNEDRIWNLEFTDAILAGLRKHQFQTKQTPEPFTCPHCKMTRKGGSKCQKCGFECKPWEKSRLVIQHDGTIREMRGDIFRERRVRDVPENEKRWKETYWRMRKAAEKGRNGITFRQVEGLFFRDHGYYPPPTLPLMPKDPESLDWYREVIEVPFSRLNQVPKPEPAIDPQGSLF